MSRWRQIAALVAVASGVVSAGPAAAQSTVRFRPVHLVVDAGDAALAAYQVELVVREGEAQIVGVEGGEHPAFAKPPYYDPEALMGGRIILAAFSTASGLPRGVVRVATLHLREATPQVVYAVRLQAAADAQGRPAAVKVTLVIPEQ